MCLLESRLPRVRISGRADLGAPVPLPPRSRVFSDWCGSGDARAGVWCAVEQRVGTISFLHAWLSLSVGTDRLRG